MILGMFCAFVCTLVFGILSDRDGRKSTTILAYASTSLLFALIGVVAFSWIWRIVWKVMPA
jgi:MFS family permease